MTLVLWMVVLGSEREDGKKILAIPTVLKKKSFYPIGLRRFISDL